MKKSIFVALSACALVSCLTSCGEGIKNTFSITTEDPIISLSEAKLGIKISIASGYKFLEYPSYDQIKMSSDKGDKMTFEVKTFNDPSKDYWIARTDESGTYKVSLTIGGAKSTNDLVITVKEGQYVEDVITFPENIHITFDTTAFGTREFYKIGSSYVACREGNSPEFYIPDLSKNEFYSNTRDGEDITWKLSSRSPKNVYNNMIMFFRIRERGEYTNKAEKTVTFGDKTFDTTEYSYPSGLVYECIRTDSLAIVNKLTGTSNLYGETDIEVKAIDFGITSFPESLKLPK